MRRSFLSAGVIAAVLIAAAIAFVLYVLIASGDAGYWEGEIAAIERRDISNPPPRGAILFLGGRDVRFWDTLADDMAPEQVIARGFGGAHVRHLTYFAGRIVGPYEPRGIVVLAGEADLADVRGVTPEQILEDVKVFVAAVRAHGVDAPILFVSIKPSPLREVRWPGAKRTNTLIADYAAGTEGIEFVDATPMLTDDTGNMKGELYRWDGLTLNADGYWALTSVVRPAALDLFGTGNPSNETNEETK